MPKSPINMTDEVIRAHVRMLKVPLTTQQRARFMKLMPPPQINRSLITIDVIRTCANNYKQFGYVDWSTALETNGVRDYLN